MEPTREQLDNILDIMEPYYKGCAVNVDDFDTYENFLKCVRSLDFTSSPGYPFMHEASTIGAWLGYNGMTFDQSQLEKLWLMVQEVLIDNTIEAYWRVFIKQEPHKAHKMESKRYRLIMCPPLPLQVVWQMVFSAQNAIEIEKAYEIPSQQGLILPQGNWMSFYSQWKHQGTTWGTDAVAWDWTLPGWVFKLDLEYRARQTRGYRFKQWMDQAAKLYENAFKDCKLLFSNGRVFQQQCWGVMKSGCVNTISTNSHGGVMYHILYSMETGVPVDPMAKVVGDDKLVSEAHTLYCEVYEKYGNLIKSVSPNLEFVGHEFHSHGPRPMYIGKHVFNFKYVTGDNILETLDSYLRLNALNDDGWDFWYDVALRLGLANEVLSRRYYIGWYNNPDGARLK